MASDSMELEPSRGPLKRSSDKRRHMPEPPPVRLVAVEDVHIPAAAGDEVMLDAFYIGVLQFEREESASGQIVYKSETFRLRVDVLEPPIQRDDYRLVMIEVPSLSDLEKKLVELEIDYERHRGLTPGSTVLVLQDPAGNWVEIGEFRRVA